MTGIRRNVFRIAAGLLAGLGAIAVTAPAVAAQEEALVGTWDITTEAVGMPSMPEVTMTWTFAPGDDGALTGSWTAEAAGENITQEMSDISVDGVAFGFIVRVNEQGEVGEFVFEGTMAEDEVSGTFEIRPEGMPAVISGTFSGARANGATLGG
ncbi:hypothetical protein [Candidatus Palauibacter sp.]|uniref:hypothetical protein n=1 Tax=Candidatus Palauibacter sp. TaxID=3101350 RepID=UPI003B521580